MTREFADFLDDMLDFARTAMDFVDGMTWERFATARAIEIVGEAARRIPDDVQRRFPAVP